MLADRPNLVSALYNPKYIDFWETSSYMSVQFFFVFHLAPLCVVNLPERTKTGLITGLDETVRAKDSCNSLLGRFILSRLASYI